MTASLNHTPSLALHVTLVTTPGIVDTTTNNSLVAASTLDWKSQRALQLQVPGWRNQAAQIKSTVVLTALQKLQHMLPQRRHTCMQQDGTLSSKTTLKTLWPKCSGNQLSAAAVKCTVQDGDPTVRCSHPFAAGLQLQWTVLYGMETLHAIHCKYPPAAVLQACLAYLPAYPTPRSAPAGGRGGSASAAASPCGRSLHQQPPSSPRSSRPPWTSCSGHQPRPGTHTYHKQHHVGDCTYLCGTHTCTVYVAVDKCLPGRHSTFSVAC